MSDKRVTNDFDVAKTDNKISMVWNNRLAVAGSGYVFLTDYFVEETNKIGKVKDFSEMMIKLEDISEKLYNRYSKSLEKEGRTYDFQVLVIGLDRLTEGQPRIRLFEGNKKSEEVKDYYVIGSGAPYALPFVKIIYDKNHSINQLWRTGFYAISTIINLELDTGVGGMPDVITLEENGSPHFLKEEDLFEGGYVKDAFYMTWEDLNKWLISKIALNTKDVEILWSKYSEEEHFRELVEATVKEIRS